MDIAWLRDLVIIIATLVAAGVLIFISVLVFSVYRRVKSILDSAKIISRTMRGLTSLVGGGGVKQIVQIVAVVQGVYQGITVVRRLFARKGGKDD